MLRSSLIDPCGVTANGNLSTRSWEKRCQISLLSGVSDHLNDDAFMDAEKSHLIVFDDLMIEAKCDQHVADYLRRAHIRNWSVIYFTQNLFPQGKACRDIALNTEHLVLFNNPIDRQQVAMLAKRIYPSASASFMRRFEEVTSRPYALW